MGSIDSSIKRFDALLFKYACASSSVSSVTATGSFFICCGYDLKKYKHRFVHYNEGRNQLPR